MEALVHISTPIREIPIGRLMELVNSINSDNVYSEYPQKLIRILYPV